MFKVRNVHETETHVVKLFSICEVPKMEELE